MEKKVINNKIIFEDLKNNSRLNVIHYDDPNVFDEPIIDKQYSLDFVDYFVKELTKTNDIYAILSNYDSKELENLMFNNDFRVFNYQYIIKYRNFNQSRIYDVENNLNDESKKYFLKHINNMVETNNEYLNPNQTMEKIDDKYFDNVYSIYRVYKENNKIVGIVNYSDSNDFLGIYGLFGENQNILDYIVNDLLINYKKDIYINILYSQNDLKRIVENNKGKLRFCEYVIKNQKQAN